MVGLSITAGHSFAVVVVLTWCRVRYFALGLDASVGWFGGCKMSRAQRVLRRLPH